MPLRFAMALHNHQPVGNFDWVVAQAHDDSYRPFLDALDARPGIPFALHLSGCLLDWLDERRPDYLVLLRKMVARGQVEILGGGYQEPILPMLPRRDRRAQVESYSDRLHELFGARPRGVWLAERVWEQCLASDLADAGAAYTIVDDYHFRSAGLAPEDLHGYYLTEDEGKLLRIFPGSERARYLIPFQEPRMLIEHLAEVHARHPDAAVLFADDGEKFGTWPETKTHVYDHGWLRRFLDALDDAGEWLKVCLPRDILAETPPLGKIYLPDCSYREMTEWALPAPRLAEFRELERSLEGHPQRDAIRGRMRGGGWRNFKVRYPETDEMYARMLGLSERLAASAARLPASVAAAATRALHRGQCNCPYWHGAFGGMYLPHLRHGVFAELIRCDNLLRPFEGRPEGAEALEGDFNLDGGADLVLSNNHLVAFVDPQAGGLVWELDVRDACLNLGGTISRRYEAYHDRIRRHGDEHGGVGSIHERVTFKQPGLEQLLQVDRYPRKTLVEHFWPEGTGVEQFRDGTATELGGPPAGPCLVAGIRRHDDGGVSVEMRREFAVAGLAVAMTKTLTLAADRPELFAAYRLELPAGFAPCWFAVESNFGGLASGADDRYYRTPARTLGRLEETIDTETAALALHDDWLGIAVRLAWTKPARALGVPVRSVNGSEGGFEAVHQQAAVAARWLLPAGPATFEVSQALRVAIAAKD